MVLWRLGRCVCTRSLRRTSFLSQTTETPCLHGGTAHWSRKPKRVGFSAPQHHVWFLAFEQSRAERSGPAPERSPPRSLTFVGVLALDHAVDPILFASELPKLFAGIISFRGGNRAKGDSISHHRKHSDVLKPDCRQHQFPFSAFFAPSAFIEELAPLPLHFLGAHTQKQTPKPPPEFCCS